MHRRCRKNYLVGDKGSLWDSDAGDGIHVMFLFSSLSLSLSLSLSHSLLFLSFAKCIFCGTCFDDNNCMFSVFLFFFLQIILRKKGEAELRARKTLNCEKKKNYKFDIVAVACSGEPSNK